MITTRTTLVLGAGASQPYGYPNGSALIDQIIQRLSMETGVNPNYFAELLELRFTSEHIRDFVRSLKISRVRSIDEFLEHRSDFREIGKVAIAQVIIGVEAVVAQSGRDPLYEVDQRHEIQVRRWYPQLLSALGASFEELGENKLNIVTFNYDRSIEQFLYSALIAKYGPHRETKIGDWLRAQNFVHVHGKLGHLPWQSTKNVRSYGARKNLEELRESGQLITIVYEGEQRAHTFDVARRLIDGSDRILFLGFGYHPENLRRLGLNELEREKRMISGTRFGLTDLEVRNIVLKTNNLRGLTSVSKDHGIHDFLREEVILDGVAAANDPLFGMKLR